MNHSVYFRKLSEEDKLILNKELKKLGWIIGGEGSVVHSPETYPYENKVSFYSISCASNNGIKFPAGYIASNDELCTHCGLPISITYSEIH